ncbi:MAG TPA: FG-GAP-like repeat-containing protein, partial [Ignavibacteria bacterium]|nr:FG-GAP-like repeat-containing protein [Ignavibacteria bacterium]
AESNQTTSWYGQTVSTAGDVNGDGFSDVIVGAAFYSNGEDREGKVFVYYGAGDAVQSLIPDVVFNGEFGSDRFGTPANPAGDVNGDGFADIIIGAPAYLHDNIFGRSYIYYGGAVTDDIADVILPLKGVNNLEFPWIRSACGAGDVNGDGFSDVIVQSKTNSAITEFGTDIYFGGSNMNTTPDVSINGYDANDVFGVSVADAGDVNGDGYSDVIVGDPGDLENTIYQLYGKAFIYFGGPAMDNVPDITMYGEHWRSNFGFSVSPAGDFNGDGYADVIVGSPFWAPQGSFDVGKTYIFYGGPDIDNVPDLTMTGYVLNNFFGYTASTAGDVNNDGYSDVIVGTSERDDKAYIFFGGANPDNIPDVIINEPPEKDSYDVVFMNEDFDGDSYSDVIVGNPHYDNNTGRAYIYRGGENMDNIADYILTGEEAGSRFGSWVSTAGDVNKDGYSDIIVSAPWYQNRKGRAYLYYGSGDPSGTLAALSVSRDIDFKQSGEQVCLTGNVMNKLNLPMNNIRINFFVRGANEGYSSGLSDGNGNVQFCYAGLNNGMDTVIAVSGKFKDTAYVFWQTGNECISGPVNVVTNTVYQYSIETRSDVYFDISNYGSTEAFLTSNKNNDTVYVNSGNQFGHFVLYVSTIDSTICAKHVYVDNPLPVELSAFTSSVNARDIVLNWTTSSELNNSGFEIERYSNNTDWIKAGFVNGSGTVNSPVSYSFTDKNLTSGKYKYRLRQIDFNGNFRYYELLEEISIGIPDKYKLSQNYPNPFNPVTNLEFGISE